MKITIEPTSKIKKRTIIIQSPYDDNDIYEVWSDFIQPALIAWGFTPDTVDVLVIPELRTRQDEIDDDNS